jgi:branched-chain amino acid transport system permease protein
MSRWVQLDARLRSVLVTLGLTVLVLAYAALLPGASRGRGTPSAILFNGVVLGLLNALTAAGIVVVYRTTRVINFAQTAIGAAGGELTFQLLQLTKVPFAVAFPLGVVLAGLVGFTFDIAVGRRFFRSPRLVLTVATIATAGLLSGIGRTAVNALPFFPRDRTLDQLLGANDLRNLLPFSGWHFQVGALQLRFGFVEVFAIDLCLLSLLLVAGFFRYTRSGVAVRAMAENTDRASLLGISVGSLSSIVWTIAGLLSGVGVILTGLVSRPETATGIAPTLLLPALAAAVLARMRSIPWVVLASVAISMLTRATLWSFRNDAPLVDGALFLVIAGGLLLQRRTVQRTEEGAGSTWAAAEEQRPVPKELAGVPTVRITKYAFVAVGVAALAIYPFVVSTGPTVLGGVIALNAIVALSVVVLTGWAGQVSLGQYALVAVGAVVGGALTRKVGVPFWFAVPIASGVTAAFAVVIGIPALRIKGLFLAVTTFAFAVAVSGILFSPRYFGWLLPDQVVRPTLLLVDFEDERSMYFLCAFALVLSIVAVSNLRRTHFGRVLIAVRDNEANVQTFGTIAIRAKLSAFAVSGALCGFAGAIFAHQQRGISAASFVPQRSIDLFLLAVLGGVTSVSGALLGSAYFNANTYFFPSNAVFASIQPFAVLLLLYAAPGGLISLVNQVRDGALRIIALRRNLVVPSLFADYDAEAAARKLVSLGPASDGDGLALLPPGTRFDLPTEIHGVDDTRTDAIASTAERDAELLSAAATASELSETTT